MPERTHTLLRLRGELTAMFRRIQAGSPGAISRPSRGQRGEIRSEQFSRALGTLEVLPACRVSCRGGPSRRFVMDDACLVIGKGLEHDAVHGWRGAS
jgi:hypothetical protein